MSLTDESSRILVRYIISLSRFTGLLKKSIRGEHEINLKNKTLERYLKLIMSYYGYSEKKIISRKNKNFLKPLFYVTVQFN